MGGDPDTVWFGRKIDLTVLVRADTPQESVSPIEIHHVWMGTPYLAWFNGRQA